MFTKYAITVIDTVSTRDGSRSHTADKAYFEKLSSYNGYLHASSTVTTTFDSQEAAENFIEELPVSRCGEYNNKYEYGVEAIEYTHANHSGWSDVHPYEIVRVVSPKTIEIRVMDAELDKIGSLRSLLVALLVTAQTKALRSGFTNQTLSTP